MTFTPAARIPVSSKATGPYDSNAARKLWVSTQILLGPPYMESDYIYSFACALLNGTNFSLYSDLFPFLAYTDFSKPEQDAAGSSTMISQAHWHLLTTRVLLVVRIAPCASFYTLPTRLQPLCFWTTLSELFSFLVYPSLVKYFSNWYSIMWFYCLTFPWNEGVKYHLQPP